MKKKNIGIICVIIMIMLAIVIPYYLFFSWGEKGELSLSISSNDTYMDINGSINITYTLTNTGDTDLRVLNRGKGIQLFDSNGSEVRWTGPVDKPKPLTNDDLHTLKSHESKSDTMRTLGHFWDLRKNETYKVVAYYNGDDHDSISLPYWKGKVWSNEIYFNIE